MTIENETTTETPEDNVSETESTDAEVSETENEPSLEDTVTAIADRLASEKSETDPTTQKPVDEKKTTPEKTSAVRDANGKFLSPKKEKAELTIQNGGKYEAPARFPVELKETFNKMSADVQKETVDFWGKIEERFTKGSQDIARYRQRYGELEKVIGHYVPQWNLSGMSDVQAVAELCATQDLIMKDPIAGVFTLMAKTGITPQMLHDYQQSGGKGITPAQNGNAQKNIGLTREDVFSLMQEFQQGNQAATANQQAANEILELRKEISGDGRYLWPELWDDNQLSRVKPLVADFRKTQPNISWAEASKKAVQAIRYLDGKIGSPSPLDPRLNREQEIAKAKAASVSVRGRGGVNVPSAFSAKQGEKVEDSVRAAYQSLISN